MFRDWQHVVLGLRKTLKLTQESLADILQINRRSIGRYEEGTRNPCKINQKRILEIIEKNNLEKYELNRIGKEHSKKIRQISKSLKLKYSSDLSELIGIILGDGSLRKDGEVVISYNSTNDQNFLQRRVIPLINKILGEQQFYNNGPGEKCFHNKSFFLFLKEKCNSEGGKKTETKNKIPDWCFTKKEYLSAVVRGLFDTDGTFAYHNSPTIRLGRFSGKCTYLVKSIEKALKQLSIKFIIEKTKDDNFVIKLNSREKVITFFNSVGSSNIRHITRFLLWRINKYKARIELEGYCKLIYLTNKIIKRDIREITLPFLWDENNVDFRKYIEKDFRLLGILEKRRTLDWQLLVRKILENNKSRDIAKALKTGQRNVNRWAHGDRIPHEIYVPQLLNLIKTSKVQK